MYLEIYVNQFVRKCWELVTEAGNVFTYKLSKHHAKFLQMVFAKQIKMAHCLPTSLSSGPCVTVVLLLNLLVEDVAGGVGENHINVVVPSCHNLHQSHHICRIAVERPEILGCFRFPPLLSHGSTPWRCQAAQRSVRHSRPDAKPKKYSLNSIVK